MITRLVQLKEITNIYSQQSDMNYNDWNLKSKSKYTIGLFSRFKIIR